VCVLAQNGLISELPLAQFVNSEHVVCRVDREDLFDDNEVREGFMWLKDYNLERPEMSTETEDRVTLRLVARLRIWLRDFNVENGGEYYYSNID